MANPLPQKRTVERQDLVRMNLPQPLWGTTVDRVPETVRGKVEKYLGKIVEARHRGLGLYLWGQSGVGKSAVGSVILREARAWGFTAFFISVAMLREAVRDRRMFDSEISILERVRTVDFLVIDGLTTEDLDERFFTAFDLRTLIVARNDCLRVTIVTSNLDPNEFRAKDKTYLINALAQSVITLLVEGEDFRAKEMEQRKSFLE